MPCLFLCEISCCLVTDKSKSKNLEFGRKQDGAALVLDLSDGHDNTIVLCVQISRYLLHTRVLLPLNSNIKVSNNINMASVSNDDNQWSSGGSRRKIIIGIDYGTTFSGKCVMETFSAYEAHSANHM